MTQTHSGRSLTGHATHEQNPQAVSAVPVGIASAVIVTKFACYCGFQSEGQGDTPACLRCGDKMHSWGTREVTHMSNVLSGERADTRTDNGGY